MKTSEFGPIFYRTSFCVVLVMVSQHWLDNGLALDKKEAII